MDSRQLTMSEGRANFLITHPETRVLFHHPGEGLCSAGALIAYLEAAAFLAPSLPGTTVLKTSGSMSVTLLSLDFQGHPQSFSLSGSGERPKNLPC